MESDNWPKAFDEFIEAAERDDRLGQQRAVVNGPVVEGAWDDGRRYWRVPLALTTAHNFSLDVTLNEKPTEAELEVIKSSGDTRRIKGVGLGLKMHKDLLAHYKIASPADIKEGQEFAVETGKRKNRTSGKEYVTVIKFLPPATASDKPRSSTPF